MGYDSNRNTRVTKLPKLDPKYAAFIKHLRDKCSYYNVDLVFISEPVVYWDTDDNEGAKGYFHADGTDNVLVCTVNGDPDIWMGTLVHESCHMDQWIDDSEQWSTLNKAFSKFWGWLAGDLEVSKRKLQLYTRDIQLIELDCERRAIEKIKQFEDSIDTIYLPEQLEAMGVREQEIADAIK